MSGDNRIDHFFISHDLGVRDPVYLLPPAPATDHPVHWAEIYWEILEAGESLVIALLRTGDPDQLFVHRIYSELLCSITDRIGI